MDRFQEKYFLTEDQMMIRDLARTFARKEVAPKVEELDTEGAPFQKELMDKAAELGFFGINQPEEYGGLDLDTISQMLVLEEIARVSPGFTSSIQGHSCLALSVLELGGSEEQKQKWLRMAIAGERYCSFALTEPDSGSDSGALKTRAVETEDGWILNGQKSWITNMTAGGFFLVAAKTDPEAKGSHGISIFIVDSQTPGCTIGVPEKKCCARCTGAGNVFFDDCKVPKENLVGEVNQGFPLMMRCCDKGRLGIAAVSIGIAQEAYERSVNFANQRIAFGKPISHHQAIAFYLAEMAADIDIARTMLYRTCRMRDAGMDYVAEAAAVKLFASEMAVRISEKAVQIHGGNGLSEEYGIERLWRESKLQTIGEGTSEIQKIVISRRCIEGKY